MTQNNANPTPHNAESLTTQVRSAVIWRSGTQILGQLLTWASTFVVIRLLDPVDYGLFAMTQVVLVLLNMLNGYGLASALIQRKDAGVQAQRQLFGMLILLNVGLAAVQFAAAPLAASYYRQPMVADLLRVQALIYLTTPFVALPYAQLARAMDFRRQAQANFASGIAGAVTALAGAYAGWGVWTLVAAPLAMYAVRAIGMTWAAGTLMWPSFDFRGAGDMARYGGIMAAGQIFWFVQSQADVFIAGRWFDPHLLGIYTTSLFLAQIFVSKFVPPLNEVAFSAYARLREDPTAVANAFVKSARLIMVLALPFYAGLAVTAHPLVEVVLGPKWIEVAAVVQWLALAMPFMTLQTLYAPATDACGRPEIGAGNGAIGALVLSVAFLIGVHWGVTGLVAAWLLAYPVYLALSTWRTLPVIGVRARVLGAALAPPVVASLVMAGAVSAVDHALLPLIPLLRLLALTSVGAGVYCGWLVLFAPGLVRDVVALIRHRREPQAV
ncbi:oligosaccharide flippase family protein [Sphingomonas xinjiangensis]|uniref:O-antigen/teichoic acid export membrane protein n=1 Tax=Sphingomonas xinjiangensis TaxID=643568 RepID=A0A840YH96_9SPHN|nr:O-antigen/teichoic acid export membrane protein [Sphingomonas xinjiangensis]